MSQNIIKEQEYIRVDEEPKAPKTITHNSQKYVRCDTIEQDLKRCKNEIVRLLKGYESFVNIPTMEVKSHKNHGFFIIRNLEYNPNTKVGNFESLILRKIKPKITTLFSSFNARYKDVNYLDRGKTPAGNEIWELGYQAIFRNYKTK